MKNSYLYKISQGIKMSQTQLHYNYAIPSIWNSWNYKGKEAIKTKKGEIIVNPYHFYYDLITKYYLKKGNTDINYNQSLTKIKNKKLPKRNYTGGDWIKKAVVYSMMIRTSSTWDHDRSDTIDECNIYKLKETGTFVKTLSLLPYLKKIGVDTIYLLPLSKFSTTNKKGELGSPYSVANFTKLDHNLKDPITGKNSTVEDEFKAFIEACHILNIRVMIDIIPRTNAIENDLIKQHPDWFYWIKSKDYANYSAPFVEGIGNTVPPLPKYMKQVYNDDSVKNHIKMFQINPKDKDPLLWNKIIKKKQNISKLIDENYGLKIAPGFSDHINDIQPPWTDITFFRMYLDHPKNNKNYLENKNTPPYILFDTIKSNLHPGDVPNSKLWSTLANIIPFYQKKFGIDGARIDMGHALPNELIHQIFTNAKKVDPDFCFIAEELNTNNATNAKDIGYNMIIGDGFIKEPRVFEKQIQDFIYHSVHLPCPVFACAETHDTPRIAARNGGDVLAKMITIVNMFVPNTVPFINSGQEFFEKQPMNLGLDCQEEELYRLHKDDISYSKLALFDKAVLHYLNIYDNDIIDCLKAVYPIRKKWLSTITNKKNFIELSFDNQEVNAVGIGYIKKNKILIIVANTNSFEDTFTTLNLTSIRQKSNNFNKFGKLLYATHEIPREFKEFNNVGNMILHLGKGEVKIIEI